MLELTPYELNLLHERERSRLWIVDGLVELRVRGVFYAVWVDVWTISVKRGKYLERERMSWAEAEDLVVTHLIQCVRRPMGREVCVDEPESAYSH